jgi:hypothetical protein
LGALRCGIRLLAPFGRAANAARGRRRRRLDVEADDNSIIRASCASVSTPAAGGARKSRSDYRRARDDYAANCLQAAFARLGVFFFHSVGRHRRWFLFARRDPKSRPRENLIITLYDLCI